jgi:hypothetical protein
MNNMRKRQNNSKTSKSKNKKYSFKEISIQGDERDKRGYITHHREVIELSGCDRP